MFVWISNMNKECRIVIGIVVIVIALITITSVLIYYYYCCVVLRKTGNVFWTSIYCYYYCLWSESCKTKSITAKLGHALNSAYPMNISICNSFSVTNNSYQNILPDIHPLTFLYIKNVLTKNHIIGKLTKNKFKNKCNMLITNGYLMMFLPLSVTFYVCQ
jgi:hypothetical protein